MKMEEKKKLTLDEAKAANMPYVTLKHDGAEDEIVVFDQMDRKNTWIEQAVILPWSTPQRLLGWVHSKADLKGGYVLHGAFAYIGQPSMQAVAQDRIRVVAGPRVVVPYEFLSQVDIDVHASPMTLQLKKQAPEFQEFFVDFIRRIIWPPKVELATEGAPLPPPPNGRKG
jgi:hypothetical protein